MEDGWAWVSTKMIIIIIITFFLNPFVLHIFLAMKSMETWDVEITAKWLCKIGLDKYASICQNEAINGRALLLLASKSIDQLVSVFQLKKGPQKILLNTLIPHLKAFDQNKPQTARNSTETISHWTVEKLQNWLRELHIPEDCLIEAEKEEINGKAFLLLMESGELKDCLRLKVGSWIVLEHELFLHLEKSDNIESGTTVAMSRAETTQSMPDLEKSTVETNEMVETKEPLPAIDPSTKSVFETLPKKSKEEEKLLLLQNALQLDIDASSGSKNIKECLVRSIFVKRGKGANALESFFNFIVVTKEEMTADKLRKLWSKITEKTAEWIKLLPKKDSDSFRLESDLFVHVPSTENVVLRDGKVTQIPLGNISDDEYKQSVFVILVDKQFLEEKKMYNFFWDRKCKVSYSIRLNVKSKYHASFDPNSPDLKWSKHFRSLTTNTGALVTTVTKRPQSDPQPSSTRDAPRQIPRRFNSEFESKYYTESFVFPCWETGSKDLIKPAHEFKLLRTGVSNSDEDNINKFVYETLRFACGCLNERTNGTIHFGVADELEGQTCGYQPREIVGSWVTNKPRYNEKLTEFIDKCFVGDSRSNVHNCIRPPVFIPVKSTDAELPSYNKVVIEVDIEPCYSFCAGEIFKVGFKGLGRGKEEAVAYIRHGSQTQAIVEIQKTEDLFKRLPKLDEERKTRERERDAVQGTEKQDSRKHLYDKLKRLLCANKKVLDSSVYPILVLSKPGASMNQDFLDKTFRFIQNINWRVVIDFDDQGSDCNGICNVFKSGPHQCEIHEAEDYDMDDNLIERIYHETHWIFGNGFAKLSKETLEFKQWNNSTRKRGLSLVIQSLAKTIPEARAVVLFLLFSKECEPMADTFKDFCTYLNGPNQLVYVAENAEIVTDWEAQLSHTCLQEHQIRERGVVGMTWREFQECMQQIFILWN